MILTAYWCAMVRDRCGRRSRKLSLSGWVTLGVLGAALVGWLIMLVCDPVTNETTRTVAVLGALAAGVVLGIAHSQATAVVIARVLGPLWRAVLVVLVWIPLSFMAVVTAIDDVIPAAHERAPLLTLTVMLVLLGALAFIAMPFVPVRNLHTGVKTGKNASEALNLKSFWRYAFFQYGGFFYGLVYILSLVTGLSFGTIDPAGHGV